MKHSVLFDISFLFTCLIDEDSLPNQETGVVPFIKNIRFGKTVKIYNLNRYGEDPRQGFC